MSRLLCAPPRSAPSAALRLLATLLAPLVLAGASSAYDLDPGFGFHAGATFRQDEVEAREHDLTEDYYAAVFTFRHPLALLHTWRRWRSDDYAVAGYRVTVGSLTNDDFYLEQEAFVGTRAMDGRLRLRYRFVMDEDFDSRYLKNQVEVGLFPLIGLGRLEALYVATTAELVADKETVDFGVALGHMGERLRLRLDAIFPDLTFNDKAAEEARFRRYPRTLVARAEVEPADGVAVGLFAEGSTPLRLDSTERDFRFFMVKQRVGAYAHAGREERVGIGVELSYERARKRLRVGAGSRVGEGYDLDRDALIAVARARVTLDDDRRWELLLGAHLLFLDETRRGVAAGAADAIERRAEGYGSIGVRWLPDWWGDPVDRSFALTPELFVGYAHREEERDRSNELFVRLAPRIELFIEPSLRIVLNPTMRLDDMTFGGGNVHVAFAL